MKKVANIIIILGIIMISSIVLAFPKDENGYKEFYFGEDVNDVLSKYEVKSVENTDDGSVNYTIEYEDESLEQYDIFAVPDMKLEFKDGKLYSVTRFFAGASPGHASLTFLKIASEIEKDFGKEQIIEGSKKDKIVYYGWRGKHCTIILVVDLNPLDIPDPDVKLYRVFFTISPIE